MSGLRGYRRDTALIAEGGDAALAPPVEAELLDLVGEHLARPGAPRPTGAELEYARWKPGTSLTVGYALAYDDGEELWVSWKRYADGKAARLTERPPPELALEARNERLRESYLDPATGAHLWAPPYDRELPGLERACDLRRTKRFLLEQGVFAGRRVRSASSTVEVLRYKPERRAVLLLDLRLRPVEGGPKTRERLAARALPPREASRVLAARSRWHAAVQTGLTPRLVTAEERTGLLFEEWLDVVPRASEDFTHAGDAGALLARVHAHPAPGVPARTRGDMSSLVDLFGASADVARAAERLREPAPPREHAPVWIHGDFHPDQVAQRSGDEGWVLMDLDRLGAGDPLDDLASWVADRLAAEAADGLGAASGDLLEGYASAGAAPPAEDDLAVVTAAALVHRAAAALRRLELGATKKAVRLLDLARELAPCGTVFA